MKILNTPRLMVASHRGGAGKTIVSLGLLFSFKTKNLNVVSYKKGPDYIDAGWLSSITGKPCRNLDLFILNDEQNLYTFYLGVKDGADVALIEGNRGLYDGVDWQGSCSSAQLARLLKTPVIFVLDCTKATRSMAALLKGFVEFEKDVNIVGVILNNIARPRHEDIIRASIENYVGISVLGSIPKLKHLPNERHLGLITSYEFNFKFLPILKETFEKNVDLDKVLEIARNARPLLMPEPYYFNDEKDSYRGVKIAVFYDKAFQFYYPENLEILQYLGAELVYVNALKDRTLPEVDGIYLGGGFPEVYAEALAENESLRKDVYTAGEEGIPIFAECGGLMYLGKEILWKDKAYPMVGLLPIRFIVEPRPQGHGYVVARCVRANPYFPEGEIIKGHEFHYSRPEILEYKPGMEFSFKLEKGTGFGGGKDGLQYKKIFASYVHIHFLAISYFPKNFLKEAKNSEGIKLNKKKEVAYV